MGEWIKCSERLPDDSCGSVLIFTEEGWEAISVYGGGTWLDPSDDPEIETEFTVTHWQPLPEPPEQQ